MFSFITLLPLFTLATAVPRARSSDCVGEISSLEEVDAAVQCATVNIKSFTVPAGKTFGLDLMQGTTVNVLGDIQFSYQEWEGPLFVVTGEDINFKGNGHRWDGKGESYWDGLGGSGGATKPSPMIRIEMSGTFQDVHVLNSPERCISVVNPGPLVISSVIVDDSQGNNPNAKSNGRPAGRNTDGFDVAGNDVTIKYCEVLNQDDCMTINRGENIVFENNYCDGGHGISIGSICSDTVVDNVLIKDNKVVNSIQGFRIKTKASATNSRVSNVTYSGNVAESCDSFGFILDQSYPQVLGDPGSGVDIHGVVFSAEHPTELAVASDAKTYAVNCGEGSCSQIDFSGLRTSGGTTGTMLNVDVAGYSTYS